MGLPFVGPPPLCRRREEHRRRHPGRCRPGYGRTGPQGPLEASRAAAPPVATVTLEAMLAVDRIGLPPALVASLRHLASLHNPEFHQREQLRLSTWNTPRMVRCYDEDLDRLYLPRGLLGDATRVVEAAGSRLEVDDRRPTAPTRALGFTGQLSAAQTEAVEALAGHDLGVLVAPTGAGKTVMACALIARLATPTLVLVHTRPLAEQWRQRLGDLLGLKRREIGQLGAGRTRRSGIVDLVTLQTLARRDDAAEVFCGYGLVVVDECHHLPAVTFERCVRAATNRRWFGLTATPRLWSLRISTRSSTDNLATATLLARLPATVAGQSANCGDPLSAPEQNSR